MIGSTKSIKRLVTLTALGSALLAPLAAPAQKPEPVTIRIASDITSPPHPAAITMELFAQRVGEMIPGSTVRIYYSGALYRIPEAVEAMTDGNLEMTWGQFGKSAQIEPYMSVVNGPMLMTTPGAMNQLDKFDTYKFLAERMSKQHGVKLFGTAHLSMFMGVGASERILGPEDFTGKKIRSMGPAENAALAKWTANPVTMSFGDVPPALETKVIDGLLTSLGGFNATRDQAPYFTIAGINGVVGDYYWIGASELWWKKLNKPTQMVLEKLIVEEMIPFQKRINWCNDKRMLDKFQTMDPAKPGIYILTAAQQEVLASKLGSATTDWVKANTPDGANEWADKFVKEARAAVKANPVGSDPLEKTDCAEFDPFFDKYVKKN